MGPTNNQPRGGGQGRNDNNNEVPEVMLQQAEAAIAGENDRANMTNTERRHIGRDVPIQHTDSFDPGQGEYEVPPPAYGEYYGTVEQEQDGFGTKASVAEDGRVNIRIDQRNRRLSQLLVPSLKQLQAAADQQHAPPPPYIPPSLGGEDGQAPPPPMNVVIQVVGSRGDVQPFVALGKVLKETYGHRVRLATHPNFKDFVKENGLEFFSIGGDPQALMAFMVKNPGLMPGFDSLRTGDVGKRRKEVGEYLKGCWRSCYESGDGFGPEAKDDTVEDWTPRAPSEDDHLHKPFVADCIIANPPSFAHVHCAEKLGIPLHIMFTMPYSPTQSFPHPLANIQSSNADANLTNYISYALIDMLTWQGLGDIINRFRQRSLGLDTISLMWAPGMLQRLQIPHTYCWSPALIPKPRDWGTNINISGFFFLDLATNYTPDPELKAFLQAGPPPVYIGFGSIVLDDPTAMTKLIFDAVAQTGQRALVSKGWGGVGADELGKPDSVYMLGNVPHDWLFKQVSCVVHHGGAGTTAAGITAGRPTLVVPFFGDQQFWGSMVARAGAGPEPIPNKQLTAENLAAGIMTCLEPESQERAHELASKIATEKGNHVGAQSFHQFLDVDKLRCSLAPSRAAVWRIKRTQARLSAMAACTLAQEGLLDFNDLKLYRPREYEADEGPWDPITGGATALIGTMSTMMLGVADFPIDTLKALCIHPDAKAKKESNKEGKKPAGPERADSSSASVNSGLTGKQTEEPASSTTGTSSPSGTMTPRSTADTSMTSDPHSRSESRTNSSFNFQDSLAKLNAGPLSPGSQTGPGRKSTSSSMADVLQGQLGGSRASSGGRPRSPQRSGTGLKDIDWKSQFATGADTAKGVHRIVGAGLKSPLDFTMGLAKGFHNAPKLYGDETVRKSENVTDFKSGVRAATKEFGLGMYDGITGLVTQPFKGAVKEGPAGFVKGIGKGIGGIMLKPGAAIFGIPGYTMKGVYKEIQKQFGSSVQNYIIAARTAQGFDEYQSASPEERRDVAMRWSVLQKNLKKKRNPDEMVRDILKEQMDKKEHWLEARKCRKDAGDNSNVGKWDPEESMLAMGTDRAHNMRPDEAENRAIEEAIRLSVLETSHGDPTEDACVEQGIRGKLAEVQRHRAPQIDPSEDAALRQALEASASDAERHQHERSQYDRELEKVIAQSLKEQRGWTDSDSDPGLHSPTLSDYTIAPTDQHPPSTDLPPAYDPGHLAGTTQEDFERDVKRQPNEKTEQEKTEEQIVMEYIKKQSLLEQRAKPAQAQYEDEDDKYLQKALKASMQGRGQHGEASGS